MHTLYVCVQPIKAAVGEIGEKERAGGAESGKRWTPCLCDRAFAAHPQRGSTTRVQPADVLPPDPPSPPLAPCSSSHQIQDDGTDLQVR